MLGSIRSCFVFVVLVSACLVILYFRFIYVQTKSLHSFDHSAAVRSNIAGSVAGSRELGGTPHWAHNPKLYSSQPKVVGLEFKFYVESDFYWRLYQCMRVLWMMEWFYGSLCLSTISFQAELIDDIFFAVGIHWFQEAIYPSLLSLRGIARFCKLREGSFFRSANLRLLP